MPSTQLEFTSKSMTSREAKGWRLSATGDMRLRRCCCTAASPHMALKKPHPMSERLPPAGSGVLTRMSGIEKSAMIRANNPLMSHTKVLTPKPERSWLRALRLSIHSSITSKTG